MMILEGNFLVCIKFFIDKNNIYIFFPVRRKFAAYETGSENTFWMFINKGTPFFHHVNTCCIIKVSLIGV